MMNILSALAGFASGVGGGGAAKPVGELSAGPFAALLGKRLADAPREDIPISIEQAPGETDLAALFDAADAALSQVDLSDDELAEVLVPILTEIAALIDPNRFAPQVSTPATAEPGAALAEAVTLLRQFVQPNPSAAPSQVAAEVPEPAGVRAELGQVLEALTEQAKAAPRALDASALARGGAETVQARPDGAGQSGTETPAPAQRSTPEAMPAAVDARAPAVPTAGADAPQGLPATAAVSVSASSATAPTPAPAAPPPLPDSAQILSQLRAHVSDSGTIRVALTPEGLGRVEIVLAPTDDGQFSVTVRADQASVLGSLRADRDGLIALLRDAGHPIDSRALSFDDLGGRGAGQNTGQHAGQNMGQNTGQNTGQAGGQGASAGREVPLWATQDAAAGEITETPIRVTLPSGRIDITV